MRPSVDPTQARYFLAVVDEGHFTRAAGRLGVSQQTVSASIGRLEQNLGLMLFERTPRSVTLTEHGAQLLPMMRDLVAASERLNRAAQAVAARPGGSLRIAYTETTGHEVVPAVLDRLRAHWPELEADAYEVWAAALAPGLHDAILSAVRSQAGSMEIVPSRMLGGTGLKARLRAADGVELCARSRAGAPDGLTVIPVAAPTTLSVDITWPARAPETTRTIVSFVRSVAADEQWTDPATAIAMN